MGFREAVASVFRQYAEFNGRARRSEYWYFVLFNGLIYAAMFAVSSLILTAGVSGRTMSSMSSALSGMSLLYVLYGIYSLATIIPGLALCCRRLHDIGRPGSYMLFVLIPFVGWIFVLIWVLQEGDHGPNRFGPDPKNGAVIDSPIREVYHAPRPYSGGGYDDYRVQNTPRAQEPARVYLEGTAGCFLGHRIPVHGTMVAGRNPGCGIKFPPETHGVSHQHCQFRVTGSSVAVMDIGSTYGTFVNEKRLLPNQPVTLSSGDTVQLGSRKQAFRVV